LISEQKEDSRFEWMTTLRECWTTSNVKFKENDLQETPAGANLLEVGKGAPLDPKDMRLSIHLLRRIYFYPSERVWISGLQLQYLHPEYRSPIKVVG